MRPIDETIRDWSDVRTALPFYRSLKFVNCGLALGRGTHIARFALGTKTRQSLDLDGHEERILALLAAAYDRRVSHRALETILNGVEDTHVEYLGDNRVQISLPNMVAITSQRFSFGPYQITYRYLPSDDPEERANYQRWIKNPDDPVATKWSEDNMRSKMHFGLPHPNE
jgi:hypothetical protein